MILWLIIAVLLCIAAYITLDLASDDIAGAFRDALHALRDALRP